MGYRQWAERNHDAIESTSSIASAIGILLVAAGLGVSIESLRVASVNLDENKKATQAQTFFNIQRFGFEVYQDLSSDAEFLNYLYAGIQPADAEEKSEVVHQFAVLLSAYNIISFQHSLEYVGEEEWSSYKQELCNIVTSKGADNYFEHKPIEQSAYDEKYKTLIMNCRK